MSARDDIHKGHRVSIVSARNIKVGDAWSTVRAVVAVATVLRETAASLWLDNEPGNAWDRSNGTVRGGSHYRRVEAYRPGDEERAKVEVLRVQANDATKASKSAAYDAKARAEMVERMRKSLADEEARQVEMATGAAEEANKAARLNAEADALAAQIETSVVADEIAS